MVVLGISISSAEELSLSLSLSLSRMGDSWQPREEGMREICSLLQEYRAPSADQTRVLHLLQRCTQLPDFNNYLAFILSRAVGQSVEVRQAAGLLLKNNLKAHYQAIAPIYQQHIKAEVLPCLGAPDKHIRSTVGTVISVIIEQGKVQCWPEVLNALLQCLESNDYNHMEGALDALSKICEDIPESLDSEIPGISERPINVFIPRMLRFFSSPHVTLRRLSLSSVNQFIVFMPSALYANMDIYLQGLFSLAKDPAPEVRKLVCSALVQFVEVEYSFLQPHIQDVIEYMLQANQDKDAEVALESCGFWTAFCEARLPPELLRDFLPRLIALLLTNMVYLDDDEALIDADVDDSVPDRDQDLRPRFSQSRIHGGDDLANGEDEDDDDEDIVNSWNLRKSSAASLDMLSNVFGDEILPILMPLVQEKLLNASESAWKEREAAVLALGAVAEGCINGLLPYLSQIVTLLLPLLDDKRPLVRSISCWTMSRYSKWVCQASSHPDGRLQFDCVLTGLLGRILDSNKRVQNSACSAFAVLEEEAQDGLLFRLELILQHLMHALGQYQRANLRVLYDAIGTLADAIRGDLNRPEYVGILMPPLMAKWQQLLDTDKDLFLLLECLTSISQALGPGFMPYAEPVFRRCVGIIRSQTIAKAGSAASGVIYDKEFVVCTLDLLSGLADGLGSSIENLIQGSDLRDLLLQCCSDEAADVRQSALGLLGDIAKICVIHLQPRVLDFLTVAANQLSLELKGNVSVANNACWAIGEVAIKIKKEVAPVAMTVLGHLVAILLNAEGFNRSLVENSAITLGRLGWVCPELISPHIEHFLRPWCRALSLIRDDVEKEDAFRGLCAMVRTNPNGGVESLMAMCEAICSWNEIPNLELQKEIYEILHGYKQMLKGGGAWEQCMLAMDPSSKDKLVKKYGI